jgi:hypothetical protein
VTSILLYLTYLHPYLLNGYRYLLIVPSPQCTLVVKFRSSGLYCRQILLQLLTRRNGTPCTLPMLPISGKFGRLTKNRQKSVSRKKASGFAILSWGFYGDRLVNLDRISRVHVGRFFSRSSRKILLGVGNCGRSPKAWLLDGFASLVARLHSAVAPTR